jgi:hypothetical protein
MSQLARESILLIGSRRFEPWFEIWGEALRRAGHKPWQLPNPEDGYVRERDENEKKRAQGVLSWQLQQVNTVLLINPFGYIGDSTREILRIFTLDYAENSRVRCLEHWGAGSKGIASSNLTASYLQIPPTYSTPISTLSYANPYTGNLLGEQTLARERIVQMIRHFEGSWSTPG